MAGATFVIAWRSLPIIIVKIDFLNVKQTYRNLRQWLIGEANYHDEQQLLRQAADDPFLADALEGYETLPEGEHAQRVARVKDAINARTSQKRRGIVYWPRIAAAVLLLCVAGAAFWWVNQGGKRVLADQMKTETENVVKPERPAEKKADTTLEKANSSTEDNFSEELEEEEARTLPAEEAINNSTQKESIRASKPIQDDIIKPEPVVAFDEDEVRVAPYNDGVPIDKERAEVLDKFGDTEGAEPAAKKDMQVIVEEPSASPEPGMLDTQTTNLSEEEAMTTYTYGQIVDQSTGEPLIGVNIRILGSSEKGTITDIDGFFVLPVSEEETEIEISYTAYESIRQFVRAGDTLALELSAGDVLLDEVVVTDLGLRSRRSKSNASIAVIPEPKMGTKRFQKYIDRNLKYPEAARDAGISGEVILSFQVDEYKRPEDIQVEQSLGYGCDQEAIRLLKEGPDWKTGTQRATITINFK